MREALAATRQRLGANAGPIDVSVKCRLGVDDSGDSYDFLCAFIDRVSTEGGVRRFVLHARKALTLGLSPRENRTVPPLRPAWVRAVARDFPRLAFTLNGGVPGPHSAASELSWNSGALPNGAPMPPIEGVMVGRAASDRPWQTLGQADSVVFGEASDPATSRRRLMADYAAYADAQLGKWCTKSDGEQTTARGSALWGCSALFY